MSQEFNSHKVDRKQISVSGSVVNYAVGGVDVSVLGLSQKDLMDWDLQARQEMESRFRLSASAWSPAQQSVGQLCPQTLATVYVNWRCPLVECIDIDEVERLISDDFERAWEIGSSLGIDESTGGR